MLRRPVCASDVSAAALLELFVTCGRELNVEFSLNPVLPMQILCFLNDIIHEAGCVVFHTESAFTNHLKTYLGKDTDFVARLVTSRRCKSVDDLLGLAEDMGLLLSSPADVSPNGAVSPTMISADSYLGVYVRSFVVALENMSFEDCCRLFNETQLYQGMACTPYAAFHTLDTQALSSISQSPAGLLRRAQDAVMRANFLEAEDLIHDFFDMHARDTSYADGAFEAKSQLCKGWSKDPRRYQQSMINMASVATQTANYRQALTAVEEAMKIAQQCGDHATVAQALLLLYHVMIKVEAVKRATGQFEGNALSVTPESVLIRCLNLSVSNKMYLLTAQAAILYAMLMCDCGAIYSSSSASYESSLDDYSENLSMHYIGDLWMLLWAASSGNFVALTDVLKRFGISPADAPKSGSIPYVEEVWMPSDRVLLCGQAAHAAARMWLRLGHPGMAGLECRRFLRLVNGCKQYFLPSSIGDVVAIALSTASVVCASSLCMQQALQAGVIARKLRSLQDVCSEATVSMSAFCSQSAIQEIDNSGLLISVLSSTDLKTSIRYCTDFAVSNHLVEQSKGSVTPLELRGQLVLALLTSISEADTALRMLTRAEEKAAVGGILHGKELAMISRAVILKFLNGDYEGQNLTSSLVLLEEALTPRYGSIVSKNGNIMASQSCTPPVIEGIVTIILEKFIRNECLEQIFSFLLPSVYLVCV